MTGPGVAWRALGDGARLLGALPALLRQPLTVAEARGILASRFARREYDFLALVARAVYQNPRSPYRPLLKAAGCEHGDLAALVGREGVEGALRTLLSHGVYLTVDELKGRALAVRGGVEVSVGPDALANPMTAGHLVATTSGSRGCPVPLAIDLAHLREIAVDLSLDLAARDGAGWEQAVWSVPGGGVLAHVLTSAASGTMPRRWFSLVDPAARELPWYYRWSTRLAWCVGAVVGRPLPWPRHVPLDRPAPILGWLRGVLDCGAIPHLWTFASAGARLCQAALEDGVDLRGARITLSGEPITESRCRTVREAGAVPLARYAAAETGPMALGCLLSDRPDEAHVLHDLHALVQAAGTPAGGGVSPGALFVSSIRPTAPVVLLNASLGDRAVLGTGTCGCPLERVGWTTRLHTIRSHEKLTSGGMTFLDVDVIPILEDVLPARFGGTAAHYQLVETQPVSGGAEVRLLVDPAVGDVDPRAVRDAFLSALGREPGPGRAMGIAWRDAEVLRVERRSPLQTRSGKILHLHVERRVPSSGA